MDESRSAVARLLRRLLGAGDGGARPPPRRPTDGSVQLSHAPLGVDVEILSLRGMPASRAARLSALGVVPGSPVRVIQRRPAPVVRVGETELALSLEILDQIEVAAPPGPRTAGARRRGRGSGRP